MENTNLVWTTDCHLNFIDEKKLQHFCKEILDYDPKGLVITGDISESQTLETHLRLIEMYLGGKIPVYFVCGNHDYYNGSIVDVRKMLKEKFNKNSMTQWLGNVDYISLNDNIALVGHDGWWDGKYSDFFQSKLDMHDYAVIKELRGSFYYRVDQYNYVNMLASQSTYHIINGIKKAFEKHNHVYVATHVAPFAENSRAPDGKMSDKHWMPHFSCKTLGDALLDIMHHYGKDYELTVLCGHNHTFWESNPLHNIRCITGQAQYRNPQVCGVFQM